MTLAWQLMMKHARTGNIILDFLGVIICSSSLLHLPSKLLMHLMKILSQWKDRYAIAETYYCSVNSTHKSHATLSTILPTMQCGQCLDARHGTILKSYFTLLLVELHETKSAAPGTLWR